MYTWLSIKIANHLFDTSKDDQSDKAEWTRYFIEIVLLNCLKTALILAFGIMFKAVHMTIISQFVFFCLRRYALGWHSKSNFLCSVQCVCLFVGIPILIVRYKLIFPPILWLLIYIGMFLVFILHAPQKTENTLDNPLTDKQRKTRLLITSVLLVCLSMLINVSWIRIGIFSGFLAASLMVLPSTKKIIEGDVFYETYKKIFRKKDEPMG